MEATKRPIDFAETLSLGWRIYLRTAIPHGAIAAVLALPPLLQYEGVPRSDGLSAGFPERPFESPFLNWALFVGLSWILTTLTQGLFVYRGHELAEGRDAAFGEALGAVARRAWVLLIAAILLGLLLLFAALLCIFPAFIVWAMMFLVVPLVVVGKRGPIEALADSEELTKGHRWPLFFLIVLTVLANLAATALAAPVQFAGGPTWIYRGLIALAAGLQAPFAAALVAAAYTRIWSLREGGVSEDVIAAFD